MYHFVKECIDEITTGPQLEERCAQSNRTELTIVDTETCTQGHSWTPFHLKRSCKVRSRLSIKLSCHEKDSGNPPQPQRAFPKTVHDQTLGREHLRLRHSAMINTVAKDSPPLSCAWYVPRTMQHAFLFLTYIWSRI